MARFAEAVEAMRSCRPDRSSHGSQPPSREIASVCGLTGRAIAFPRNIRLARPITRDGIASCIGRAKQCTLVIHCSEAREKPRELGFPYIRTRLQVQMKCPLLSNPRVALTTFSGNAPGSPVCENARGAPHRDRMPGFRDAIGRRWTSMRQIRSLRRLDQGLDLI